MASSFRRRIGLTEKRAVRPESESWLAVLLQCVGIKKLWNLINERRLGVDLRLFQDFKPPAASIWSFDDSCFFCHARREKVKEHVAALNKKIVESGGKPLLSKDQTNVVRLEGQIEEFLISVLHRTEYRPRIPDPHIPIVARDVLLQIIRLFLVHFSSATQGQNPSTPAQSNNHNKLMPDQDAPLDLSVRKVQPALREQDRVLDLSIKKNRNQKLETPRNCTVGHTALATTRDDLEPELFKDLNVVSSLTDLINRLCFNHQKRIVDAFTFLEEEIKNQKGAKPVDSQEMTVSDMVAVSQEESCPKTVCALLGTEALNKEGDCANAQQKCVTLVIVKSGNSSNLGAKYLPEASPNKVTLERGVQNSETLQASPTSNSKVCETNISADSILPDVAPPCFPKTARKSVKTLQSRPRDTPPARCIPEDPDTLFDIVFVAKPITACEVALRTRVRPRKNARKSTRGHRYTGECWEVQTVRTLARGNCPITTSATPRQVLAKPDGIPAVNGPHTGDCVEAAASKKACSVTDQELVVEPSQTGQHHEPSSPEITDSPNDVESVKLNAQTAEGENRIANCISNCDSNPEFRTQKEHEDTPETNASLGGSTELSVHGALGSGGPDEGTHQSFAKQVNEVFTTDKSDEPPNLCGGSKDEGNLKPTKDLDLGKACPPLLLKTKDCDLQESNPTLIMSLRDRGISERLLLRDGCTTTDETLVETLESEITTTAESPATETVERPERMPLRSRNFAPSPLKTQVCTPSKSRNSAALDQFEDLQDPQKPEQMPLRSRNSAGSLTASPAERVDHLPLKSRASTVLDKSGTSEKAERMSLRSRNGITADHPIVPQPCSAVLASPAEGPEQMPFQSRNSTSVNHTSVSQPSSIVFTEPSERHEQVLLNSETSTSMEPSNPEEPCQSPMFSADTHKQMPLRSKNSTNVVHPSAPQLCNTEKLDQKRGSTMVDQSSPLTSNSPEKSKRMCSKSRRSSTMEQSNIEEHSRSHSVSSPEKQMPLRSTTSTSTDNSSVFQSCSFVSASPAKRQKQILSGSKTTMPIHESDLKERCHFPLADVPEKPEQMALRSRSCTMIEQSNLEESCQYSSVVSPKKQEQMILRSKTFTIVKQSDLEKPSQSSLIGSSEMTEQVPLRSRNRTSVEQPKLVETCQSSSVGVSEKPERMPLRCRTSTSVDQLSVPEPCCTSNPCERQKQTLSRSKNSTPVQQFELQESCLSSSVGSPEKIERMPLRSRTSTTTDVDSSLAVTHVENPESMTSSMLVESISPSMKRLAERKELMSLRSRSSMAADQLNGSRSCGSKNLSHIKSPRIPLRTRHNQTFPQTKLLEIATNMTSQDKDVECQTGINTQSIKHMPLRSESTFRASESPLKAFPESLGTMSLRSGGSSEKPSRCKKPPRSLQLSSKKSLLHFFQETGSPSSEDSQARSKAHAPASFSLFDLPTGKPESSHCKFLEALSGEASQRSLLDLNSKFEKMHKGWVHTDKEGQPAAKPKNKADRLKEIWKTKRRTKKARSLEQHKVSPIQMLFMRSFDLPRICRWFLQTTETRSLVIVKKVNTRLPSETHLGFPNFSSASESSGVFPSLQAERLKKHLKKFAIMSPVRSNPKNKRLIAKALANGAKEPSGVLPKHGGPRDAKRNPASARILRKYSNMRLKTERTSKDKTQKLGDSVTRQDISEEARQTRKRKLYPIASEDQVLTRSQGKLDIELSPTGVMKPPKKPKVASAKRSKTTK